MSESLPSRLQPMMATPMAERPGFLGGAIRLAKRTYALDYLGFALLQGAFALVGECVEKHLVVELTLV